MAPVSAAPRRYIIELFSALALYAVMLVLRARFDDTISEPLLRDVLILSPILPIVLAALAVLRLFKRIDEYHRQQMLEALAIAAAFTCVISISWTFLVDVGIPQLGIMWAWPIFAFIWTGTAIVLKLRDKASEGRAAKTLLAGALQVGAVLLATAVYGFVAEKAGWPHRWPVLLIVGTILLAVRIAYNVFTKKDPC